MLTLNAEGKTGGIIRAEYSDGADKLSITYTAPVAPEDAAAAVKDESTKADSTPSEEATKNTDNGENA